jgi:hypothetical protein
MSNKLKANIYERNKKLINQYERYACKNYLLNAFSIVGTASVGTAALLDTEVLTLKMYFSHKDELEYAFFMTRTIKFCKISLTCAFSGSEVNNFLTSDRAVVDCRNGITEATRHASFSFNLVVTMSAKTKDSD